MVQFLQDKSQNIWEKAIWYLIKVSENTNKDYCLKYLDHLNSKNQIDYDDAKLALLIV